MSRIAVGLSVLALGLSGYTAWSTGVLCGSCGKGCAAPVPDDAGALSARVHDLEQRLPASGAPSPLGGPKGGTPTGRDLASAPKPLPGIPADAITPSAKAAAETIAALEKRLVSLEEKAAARLHATEFAAGAPSLPISMPTDYASVEDAAEDLDLSPRQKDDFARASEDAKRESGELKKLPDADGETWESVEKGLLAAGEGGAMRLDLAKVFGFPSRKIPGRTETFGEAQGKIAASAKRRMRDTLTPDQQTQFDKANVDPLVGGGGSSIMSFSFSSPMVIETEEPAMK